MKSLFIAAAAALIAAPAYAVSFDFGGSSGTASYNDDGLLEMHCTYSGNLNNTAYWVHHSTAGSNTPGNKYITYLVHYESTKELGPYALGKVCYLQDAFVNGYYANEHNLDDLTYGQQIELLNLYRTGEEELLEEYLLDNDYPPHVGDDDYELLFAHVVSTTINGTTVHNLPGLKYYAITYTVTQVVEAWNMMSTGEQDVALDNFPGENAPAYQHEEWVYDYLLYDG